MQCLIVFNLKSQSHIYIMTAFIQCFWIFAQSGVASFRNLASSFGEVYDPFCTVCLGASFIYFPNFPKYGTWFPDFSDSRPKKIGFLAWGRFWHFFLSQKTSIYLQFCKFYINSGRCSTQVFPMNLPVNMALAPFFEPF